MFKKAARVAYQRAHPPGESIKDVWGNPLYRTACEGTAGSLGVTLEKKKRRAIEIIPGENTKDRRNRLKKPMALKTEKYSKNA